MSPTPTLAIERERGNPAPDPGDLSQAGVDAWGAWLHGEEVATCRRVELLLAAGYGQLAGRGELGQAALDDVLDALDRIEELGVSELRHRLDRLNRRRTGRTVVIG